MSDKKSDEDLLGRIDEATAGHTETELAEAVPSELEKRLRLLVPGYAYWRIKRAMPNVPAPVEALLQSLGNRLRAVGAEMVQVDVDNTPWTSVAWTTPKGFWVVEFRPDRVSGTYTLEIDGHGVDIDRDGQTADQVVDLLVAVGALRRD